MESMVLNISRYLGRAAYTIPLIALACCIGVQKDTSTLAIDADSNSVSFFRTDAFSLKEALEIGPDRSIEKLKEMLAKDGAQPSTHIELKKTKVAVAPEVLERRKHIKKLQRWKAKDRLGKARNLVKDFTCEQGPEALALALVLERDFPNSEVLDKAIQLHQHVIQCESALREDSALRLATLSLIKNDCEVSQAALKVASEHNVDVPLDRITLISNMCLKSETIAIQNPWSGYGVLLGTPDVNAKSEGPWYLTTKSGSDKWDNILVRMIELFEKNDHQRMRVLADHFDLASFSEQPRDFQTSLITLLHFAEADFNVFQLLNRILSQQPSLMSPELTALLYPVRHWELISKYSSGIDPLFVKALIRQESAFNPKARSRAKAAGLMQIIPSVGRIYGIRQPKKLTDPELNVKAGSAFMRSLVKKFGSYELALAAYNAGPNHVRDWMERYPTADINLFVELIPFEETREYVRLVMRNYRIYQQVLAPQSEHRAAVN